MGRVCRKELRGYIELIFYEFHLSGPKRAVDLEQVAGIFRPP